MAVRLSVREEFALVTLDRPDALNALSNDVLDALSAAFDDVAASDARALLITGAGDKAFCAGADITELIGRPLSSDKRASERGQAIFQKLDALPILSVAIVNGYAFGGGLELALACSFRLATRNARLALPEIKLGLIPGYGGTQRLPRLVGQSRALELILSGRAVDAEEALRIGLVDRVIDGDPVEAGVAFARTMTRHSLPVLGFARQAVTSAGAVPLAEGLKIEAQLSTLAYRTRDAEEGIAAFLEKRKARFEDR
jgi:enoyl-CoA hydratase